MSHKSARISTLIDSLRGGPFDPHYLGYFECFNRQLFFEAHEVLEVLWLVERGRANDLFYKGLIQLAGAFVHVQKQRAKPALALLKMAANNLGNYPPVYQALDLGEICKLIQAWTALLDRDVSQVDPLPNRPWPELRLKTTHKIVNDKL